MIKRTVENTIEKYLQSDSHKIFFIWGPRRSGKTTILKSLSTRLKVPLFNFDTESDKAKFTTDRSLLKSIAASHQVILIDEVQNHPQATIALKILFDEFNIKIIATGSSELRQKNNTFDTLTGRFIEAHCLPLSIYEIYENQALLPYEKPILVKSIKQHTQIFGSYPELYASPSMSDTQRITILENILETFVVKDITTIYDLRNNKLAKDILTKVALQIGSEVSLREIASSLSANVTTVSNYIEIFIKNYILFPLPSFKTNMRKAVSENRKLYFYDLGLRNALLKDFRPLELRPDLGGINENFIVAEIQKELKNEQLQKNIYFYREYGGKEIDLIIEDYYKNYTCVEIKSTKGKNNQIFPLPNHQETITSLNYFEKIKHILQPHQS